MFVGISFAIIRGIDVIFKENVMDPIFDLAMIAVVAIMVAFNIFG